MPDVTPLQQILANFRAAAVTEREKGTYFEELICVYLRNEPTYADLYSDVWMLADVPDEFKISKADTGIDLVARTRGTGEFHAYLHSPAYKPVAPLNPFCGGTKSPA